MCDYEVGAQVSVRGVACTVQFVGFTRFAEGQWIGVEFPTACGRNDGSVDSVPYFSCPPRHGLFVKPDQVHHFSLADPRIERDAPAEHVSAWTTMEQVMEVEAIQAGRAGERVLRHLEQQYPSSSKGGSASPNRRTPASAGEGAKKKRPPGVLARQGSGSALAGPADDAVVGELLLRRYSALPDGYRGPTLSGTPTPEFMAALTNYIKQRAVEGTETVPALQPCSPCNQTIAARRSAHCTPRHVGRA